MTKSMLATGLLAAIIGSALAEYVPEQWNLEARQKFAE